jgi:hypothetical protein
VGCSHGEDRRTTAHRGYFHEALLYDSDEEFLAVALPFLQDGVAAGEPVLVALGIPTWPPPPGHRGNPRYRDPAQFLTGRVPAVLDPLLAHPARVELLDPTPAVARAAVRDTAAATALARARERAVAAGLGDQGA